VLKGQPVKRGEVVALSGDPDGTCVSRPHLHLEIRNRDYTVAYNPVPFIDADWQMLSSIGYHQFGGFVKDLYHPNRWQTAYDQPSVDFNEVIANDFREYWPPLAREAPAPQTLAGFAAPPIPVAPLDMKQLTKPGCCSQPWWSPDSRAIRFWDGPNEQLASIMAVPVEGGDPQPLANGSPLVSPDGQYEVHRVAGRISIIKPGEQAQWQLATGGAWPRYSPGSTRIMWHRHPADDIPGSIPPGTEVQIARADGSNRSLVKVQQGGTVYWLDDDRLLLVEPIGRTFESTLTIFTISTGKFEILSDKISYLRGLSVAPGGARIMYYTPFQQDPNASGIYALETRAGAAPTKMPFFGSYRWRDSNTVFYIPFEPGPMALVLYDIFSGEQRRLTEPSEQPFTIMNDDWTVSPDGQFIVFWEAADQALWLMTLPN
jgi:hypothetical protein